MLRSSSLTVFPWLLAFVVACEALKDLGYSGFSCDTTRGNPKNVHEVRPSDVDIVAAMGDSLSAGFGAGATSLDGVSVQYRGLTFEMGGDRDLTQHVTLPSILKIFNPNLFGQSFGQSSADVWNLAHLNAAVGGAKAIDLPQQARDLVSRMQQHPSQVDMNNAWKLINIFIGGNDACLYCKNKAASATPALYKAFIESAIQTLHDNIPRAIVSIVAMFNMDMILEVDKTNAICKILHKNECACDANADHVDVHELCREYRSAVIEIQDEGKFEKDDFTVIVQPFFTEIRYPLMTNQGVVDAGFFAPDCFHFSQYGHAIVAKLLWNNLVQPVGRKDTNRNFTDAIHDSLHCPDPACPYIRTIRNSVKC